MKLKRFAVLLLLPFLLAGCSRQPSNEPISESGMYFDTVISVKLYETDDTSILDGCMELCSKYEALFSKTIETSEISKINAAKGAPVDVSDETIDLIKKGLYYSERSGGAFDITVAPLSDLWNFQDSEKHAGTVPDAAAIDEAVSHIGYQKVMIEGNTVTLTDPQAAIDLGGIAKGYIADRLKDYIEKKDIEHALIDLGGNVLTIGNKVNHTDYQIGIQKPFGQSGEAITSVSVNDQSVVSSGVYERYFKLDGMVYHHILDPKTGYPYENGLLGVTIISDLSVDGDGLSTACFALGLENGLELINQTENTEAVFITDDYELHYSDGLKQKQ